MTRNGSNVARLVGLVVMASLLGACSMGAAPSSTMDLKQSAYVMPEAVESKGDYKIRPGDAIEIRFYYHPDHNQDNVLVQQDGKIELPLVGEVKAADITPNQLSQELKRRYSGNLRDPEIAVRVKTENTINQSRVWVGGEVAKVGFVNHRPGMTVVQAVFEAGGFKDTAAIDSVVLLRKVGEPNEYKPSKIDVAKVIEEGETAGNILLGPSDILVVPKTGIAKLNQYVEQYIIKMMPIRLSISPI
jgi:protein involved in polysaccharide export with SLBB domain